MTILFRADVDAQGGAYATGVLVLMTSAAIAVTIDSWRTWLGVPFLAIALVFIYTTGLNIYERPEGLKISCIFIATIILISLLSRALRSTELRIHSVEFDQVARDMLAESAGHPVHLVARKPRQESEADLQRVEEETRFFHHMHADAHLYFLELERGDASDFTSTLQVRGQRLGSHSILYAKSPVVANSVAAVLIQLEKTTGKLPHGYFRWTEGNPVGNLFKFVFLGEGDVAPIVHEVLRRAIPEPEQRPFVHVS